MVNNIIEAENITKQFGSFTAVSNLSFSVKQGDIYGLLGQNGAGKSTTMRMLLTLIKPTNGNILIFQKSLQQNKTSILQQIGAMIEKPDLYKYLSAYDNLRIFAKLNNGNISNKHLLKQLEMVGLLDKANIKVGAFSQGMKQRLGIAIALVHNPPLIILDEPTNGLDPQGIADIRFLIKKLAHEFNKTIIISSHLLYEIEQIATRILILDKGKKIIEDSTTNLINPTNTVVEIKTTNSSKAMSSLNISSLKFLKELPNNLISVTIEQKNIPHLIKHLVENGTEILSVHQRHNLEDYFLKLTTPNHV